MEQKKSKLDSIIIPVMMITPIIVGPEVVQSIFEKGMQYAVMGGLIGGLIGGLAFYLSNKKSNLTKILTAVFVVSSCFGILIYSSSRTESDKRNLMTCIICGYKALPKEGAECEVCELSLTEEEMLDYEYSNMKEFIREEQLDFSYFEDDEFTLNGPEVYKYDNLRYSKDPHWKPVISQAQLDSLD